MDPMDVGWPSASSGICSSDASAASIVSRRWAARASRPEPELEIAELAVVDVDEEALGRGSPPEPSTPALSDARTYISAAGSGSIGASLLPAQGVSSKGQSPRGDPKGESHSVAQRCERSGDWSAQRNLDLPGGFEKLSGMCCAAAAEGKRHGVSAPRAPGEAARRHGVFRGKEATRPGGYGLGAHAWKTPGGPAMGWLEPMRVMSKKGRNV